MNNLDELIKSMQALKEEVAKNNEAIDQLGQTIESMETELAETHEKEETEVKEVQKRWAMKRSELTKEISAAKQKKQFLETSGKSLDMSVSISEQLFLELQSMVPRQDVKDAIDILEDKYNKSEFESKSPDDLCPDDFTEALQELGLSDIGGEKPSEDEAAA